MTDEIDVPLDDELKAIQIAYEALEGLTANSQIKVLKCIKILYDLDGEEL